LSAVDGRDKMRKMSCMEAGVDESSTPWRLLVFESRKRQYLDPDSKLQKTSIDHSS